MLEVKPRPVPGLARSDPQAGLSIAEAARRTGVSVHTLRYYERAGLVVTTVDRTAGGQRRYQQLDLDWITICTRLRATGDRKSTRLNSSHVRISYAVFCLKKKK